MDAMVRSWPIRPNEPLSYDRHRIASISDNEPLTIVRQTNRPKYPIALQSRHLGLWRPIPGPGAHHRVAHEPTDPPSRVKTTGLL